MNKKALLDYALYARKELETQIAVSLNKLGIYKDHVADAHIVGDYCIIDGIQESFPSRVYDLRRTITSIHIDNGNFDDVVEEFAYTWFNRIIAIRFMEVHDYFDHGFRVLTSRDGSYEPEILKNLPYVAKDLMLEEKVIRDFQEQNKTDELFRYVLFKQCNALSGILPLLFDKEGSYLELVLPTNLLSQDSFIRKITDIPEEDFMDDVEVVGWLYQFYNSVKKDAVFASKKTITKETLPAVTQLFTPDWIVRYMADNSIGRIWMESYPDSPLKQELKYYVDDAEQEPGVKKKLEEIRYKNVDPQNISIIEPCCGSGHILVYAFDLLYKMYLEKGYDKKEIPAFILGRNLYGLDVDKRAAQLAQFSLIMKARSIDNRFFKEDRFIKPHVYEILDSQSLTKDYRDLMKKFGFSKESISLAYEIEQLFKNAKVIGSLLKVENADFFKLSSEINEIKSKTEPGLFEQYFYHHDLELLKQLCQLANVMSIKYDVMITNPPYCGISTLEEKSKKYLNTYYKNSKTDLFAAFMEADYIKKNGYRSMINMHSWMFLSSYEKLREILVNNTTLINMIHLGPGAFEMISGEVVQTVAFINKNANISNYNSTVFKLVDSQGFKEKELDFIIKKNRFIVNNEVFKIIPSNIFSYWMPMEACNILKNNDKLAKYGNAKQGLATSDNNLYLRLWQEVNYNRISFKTNNVDETKNNGFKWYPYSKGGTFRRWSSINEFIVNYENNGQSIKDNVMRKYPYLKNPGFVVKNTESYFSHGITWNDVSTSKFCARYVPNGFIYDAAGPMYFSKNDLVMLAYFNSSVFQYFADVICQGLHYSTGHIPEIPFISDDNKIDRNYVETLSAENLKISIEDWNSFESSWDFARHPLINGSRKISDAFEKWKNTTDERFNKLKSNEIKINEYFSSLFNANSFINSNVDDDFVSITKADVKKDIKSLISYFVGCILGRYSLEKDGLIYAGGSFDRTKYSDYVDEDGIVPIYQFIGIENSLLDEICNMIKLAFGDEYYVENINFISDALNRNSNESAEETINRYLNNDFYNDHLSIYKTKTSGSRPIYWMLSSGKMGAFKCLIYLHRYNKDTLGLINSKYFLPRTAMYKAERERLEGRMASGQLDAREKKNVENELDKVIKCQEELLEYGQVLDHLANQYIELDLDDGVKENYVKFQGVKLQVNGATIKKDLLVPFGLEKK